MNRRILVIDDSDGIAASVRLAAPAGYTVEHAIDGVSGLDTLRTNLGSYALILVDLCMPRLDGRATLVALRGLDNTVPVRVFTAFPTNQSTLLARELTGAPPLIKPISVPELTQQIINAIDSPPAPLRPATGVLSYAQDLVDQAERNGRTHQQAQIIVAGSSRIVTGGLREVLHDAGITTTIAVSQISQLPLLLHSDAIVVVQPIDCIYVASMNCRMLCLTDNLIDAIRAYDTLQGMNISTPWGIIVENPHKPAEIQTMIYNAIQDISSDNMFIPRQIGEIFTGSRLSEQERKFVVYDILGLEPRDIAQRLCIAPDSVRKLRSRICEKIGTDLQRWVFDWWAANYP